jgi:hypothetical protein
MGRMPIGLPALLVIQVLLITSNAYAANSCFTDSNQADFQLVSPANLNLKPNGDVTLSMSEVVDQQNLSLSATGNRFHSCTGTTPDLTISIHATSGGLPVGASATYTANCDIDDGASGSL